MYPDEEMFEEDIEPEQEDRTRARRRHVDFKKAIRKRNICVGIDGEEWYKHLHQYSKNKIHCSCPLCRCKSRYHNEKKGSNINWGQKDRKSLDDMEEQVTEWSANFPD